jgi:antitoxin VapB
MTLNIKKPEAYELARAVADATGESLTDAVTNALRERLEALRRRRADADLVLAEVAELQAFLAALPDRSTAPEDEILGYDEFGLPG